MIFPVKRVKEELNASKHQITVGMDRKELITVRAGGIEIDIPITTEETTLFKIFQRLALLHMMFDFSNARISHNVA